MTSAELASVIVASYNHSDILALTLAALARQSHPHFEIIVADDGSSEDCQPMLAAWAPRFPRGIQHVWHEDRGFRKTRILNRAVFVSRYDRLLFLDMDCLPHRDFVRNHLGHLKPGTVVSGRRVELQREALPGAEEILQKGLRLGPARLVRLWLAGKAQRIEHGVVSPIAIEGSNNSILGCNFSIYKSDLEAVNGFNEEYQEACFGEDSDLEFRLRLNGVRIRTLPNRVVQFHVHHPHRHAASQANRALYERTCAQRRVRAARGLADIEENEFTLNRYGG